MKTVSISKLFFYKIVINYSEHEIMFQSLIPLSEVYYQSVDFRITPVKFAKPTLLVEQVKAMLLSKEPVFARNSRR